ncbi:MAG: hypothetical protein IIA61_00595 [Candidatus Marinimicrobia bacterium]|nr:hypothetical protein [Candidatus Neomarinimicrobiota bacterium]
MKFYQRFTNLEIDAGEAQRRFVSRMMYVLFPSYPGVSRNELQLASRALGKTVTNLAIFEKIVQDDFHRMLDMLGRLVTLLPHDDTGYIHLTSSSLSDQIHKELEAADIDLGVDWRDGEFIPRGARLLDDKLVDDPLEWLKNSGLSTVYEPFTKALNHLLRARKNTRFLNDAVTDAYDSLEAMAKEVCDTDKKFDDIRELFVSKINASQKFKSIAKEMSQYAHAFRHGASQAKPKPNPTMVEVEAFIYTVGILIRLGTETLDQRRRESAI